MQAFADFMYDHHALYGLVPVADAFAGGVSTDIVNLKNYGTCCWIIQTGAIEDANISNVVTVDACDDTTPTTTVAMPFYRRTQRYSTTVDTWSSPVLVAAAGYNFMSNNAVANAIHMVGITAEMVEQAAPGYEYARLTIAETANKTITAAVLCILGRPRYQQTVPLTAIV